MRCKRRAKGQVPQNRAFCSFCVRQDAKILRIMQVIAQKSGGLATVGCWHISCKSMEK
jgi:hypothetical protein